MVLRLFGDCLGQVSPSFRRFEVGDSFSGCQLATGRVLPSLGDSMLKVLLPWSANSHWTVLGPFRRRLSGNVGVLILRGRDSVNCSIYDLSPTHVVGDSVREVMGKADKLCSDNGIYLL